MADNGAPQVEEDPAAAFLAQQESEIAGIENDSDGFGASEVITFFWFQCANLATSPNESNGPTDSYAAIAQVDHQRQEPESLRKWREEQQARLEALDSASKTAEEEWRAKAKKELEDWHVHQNEQMEKNKVNNSGTEWERVARLCDFNPKTNKQAKDVSRMRSVLISLKQTPLVR
uniref:Clathrin light chain n=1 Tax=Neogobius melanostomus TaxID=47308 RepID=A0A8C6TFE3_9GOBI